MKNLTKSQQERKKFLDGIMLEYYYEKNDINSTLEFLAHMYKEYYNILDGKV